jgi:TonB family protein
MRKTNTSKRAIVVSLILHSIAFIIIAFIKLGSDANAQGKVPVSFVEAQNIRVLKRSIPVRKVAFETLLDQKPNFENTLANTNDNLTSTSSNITVNTSSHGRTELRSITPISLDGVGSQKLKTDFGMRPMTVSARDTQIRTVQPNAGMAGGFKLIGNAPVELAKPEMKMSTTERRNLLQDFLNGIKKKIESKKKYPLSARNAGIEGRSGIQMTITKDGQLENVRIYESSGSEILDNAALESVKDSLPFPPIPEELEREKIELKFYLVFKIT